MEIWVKVTHDKYEHIIEMGDSAGILARKLGLNRQSILRAAWKEKHLGIWTPYKKVTIEEGDE